MDIRASKTGTRMTLEIAGRLDTTTAPKLLQLVENELSDVLHLQINLKDLEYISSAGLRVLLSAKKKMNSAEGIMCVVGANEEVMKVFQMTGFDEILEIK